MHRNENMHTKKIGDITGNHTLFQHNQLVIWLFNMPSALREGCLGSTHIILNDCWKENIQRSLSFVRDRAY